MLIARVSAAQKAYDPGASDSEIKIGNIAEYSGWGSAYGAVGRAEAAYFRMMNDRGGVNGRKIDFISLDSESDAAKSVDLARQLVEQDRVLLIFSPIGTESNLAIRAYLNDRKVPQIFVESSSAAFDDPGHFPWTMGFFPTYRTEGLAYAKYILRNRPAAKIAVLYANDDAGKEYLAGVHDGLGDKASSMIVKEASYQTSETTLDPQIVALKNSGADVFFNLSLGPFATQAIRTAYDMDWHPLQFIPNASLSVAAFLDPAGLAKASGIIANARSKGWLEPQTRTDPEVREFLEWMSKYNPEASLRDQNNVAGYERAEALVEVLRKCGDNLTRSNAMKQAASLNVELGMLRPGIRVTTSPTDYQPIKQLFLIRFNGRNWVPFGAVAGD
ncbi:MAG TPA: ABC transporter substrate-binding protein [Candidatus Baltobacteraceae bacterium]|nr:ABC transporter substrate-binding protein [Candidatus Baltobacteraceae bacterium]